jgi:uncharacterized protein YciI
MSYVPRMRVLAAIFVLLTCAVAQQPKQQEFLYRVQPARADMLTKGSTPAEDKLIGEHFEYLKKLHSQGVVILAGRTLNTDESSFGIIIFRAPDETAARKIMENDPAVRGGVMKAQLFPYRVALPASK